MPPLGADSEELESIEGDSKQLEYTTDTDELESIEGDSKQLEYTTDTDELESIEEDSKTLEYKTDTDELESIEEDSKQLEYTTDTDKLKSTADSHPPCEKCGESSEVCSCREIDLGKALAGLVNVKGLSMEKMVSALTDRVNFTENKAKVTYFLSLSVDSQMSYIEENYGKKMK